MLAVVNEVNELGETALFTAAEKGHLGVVKELLQYTPKEAIKLKNQSGFDPLHIAVSQGHLGNVAFLLHIIVSSLCPIQHCMEYLPDLFHILFSVQMSLELSSQK